MKEFTEKLIARLEEEVEYQDKKADEADVFEEVSVSHTRISMRKCYEHAIEIVNELAEEMGVAKNAMTTWIPCSERLPELTEGTESFKQSKCCLTTLKWWDGDMTESIGWYNQSGVWNEDSKNCKVIAWQPLPQPYVPKGENDDHSKDA